MVIPLAKASIRMDVAVILVAVMAVLTGLGVFSAAVYRDTVEKGFQALDNTEQRNDQVSAINESYESQILEWKNLLLRGHDEDSFYKHLSRFYDFEHTTLSTARTLAGTVADTPSLQTALDEFLHAHRRLGRKYRAAFRLYNASETDPQFVADKLVAGQDDEPRRLLSRIEKILDNERRAVRSDVDAFMALAQKAGLTIALLLMLGAVLLLFWLLNLRLVRPLRQAISVAEGISAGELDGEITINREDEIGSLLTALKTMQESLVRSEAVATRLTESLERTVAERTRELIREIAERKQAEREIRQLNVSLEEKVAARTVELDAMNKELEAFTYTVAHDLRAPLRAIDGFSQALVEEYGDRLDGEAESYLRYLREGSQEMGHLIDDLLTLSRATRGEMTREDANLSEIAAEIMENLKQTAPDRNVVIDIAPSVVVDGDPRLLRVVMENLLDNAWKFTRDEADANIEFFAENLNGKVRCIVRDNGVGFDMAYENKLFVPFQRLHSSEKFEGTGIGLSTAQRIINRHGGNILAEGAVGAGATFTFELDTGGKDNG